MRRTAVPPAAAMPAAVTIATLLALAAGCARGGPAGPGPDPDRAFRERAATVARAWQAAGVSTAWGSGFVPLQELTVPPPQGFTEETKQAFIAGWYRLAAPLPAASGTSGQVSFPDGSVLSVPIVDAATAYQALDKGDPPCLSAPPPPAVTPSGPNGSVGHVVPGGCTALTVTAARLATVDLLTSRGTAKVPAWLFTVAGLPGPVARVAVAPSAVVAVPSVDAPAASPIPGLVGAQDLVGVDGSRLTYRLGVGACDYDIRPLVAEEPDAVVVAGSVRTSPGACIDLLKLEPVTTTLAAPLGKRVVLDANTGRPLTIRTTG